MSREGISLIVIQRQLGHADLAITSRYLRGIDNTEIIQAVHDRPEPMIPAGRRLAPQRRPALQSA
jgi:integrase